MTYNNDECLALGRRFFDKFGKYPIVTFENTPYGWKFIIHKTEIIGGTIPYLRMGRNLSFAIWMVDNWKKIPDMVMVFDSLPLRDRYRFAKEIESLSEDLWA